MQIIPNFIEDKIIQEEIKNTLLGERSIPYYYNNYIVNENDKSDFHFVHFLYENNIHSHECSPMFDKILSPLIGRLKFNYLIRAKVNLYTRNSEFIQTGMHTDTKTPHMVGLYSVNTNNGYTIFEHNKQKVESIANRLVMFHGSLVHAGCSTTNQKRRVVLNLNYL